MDREVVLSTSRDKSVKICRIRDAQVVYSLQNAHAGDDELREVHLR